MLALPWLAACAAYDLRSRTVPAWLTIPTLLVAILWTGWRGAWAVSLLAITLLFMDDLPWRLRGFLAGLQGLLLYFAWQQAGPDAVTLGAVLMLLWLFWKLGAFGGADAQVLMTLALFLGPSVLIPVAFMNLLQGLAGLLGKRKSMPAMLSILAGTSAYVLASRLFLS